MLVNARWRAKRRDIPFTITVDDVHIPKRCPVLGIELVVSTKGRTDNSPSLDRINNSKGYIPGNIIVISWIANRLKSNATADQMLSLAVFYKLLELRANKK